uniref:S9 family peptidase n=1 Tax=Coralloluteibacterium stylophorae TaxID=1776034 RepID=A0A8J7VTD2_9GAMM
MRNAVSALLPLALLLPLAANAQAPDLDVEQAMADPDWIGPPVEDAWWSWDGDSVYYRLKRAGSPIEDVWTQPAAGGSAARVEDAALATIDAPDPVYDASRSREAFVRDGNVFLRDLRNGALTQVWRSNEGAADVRFTADGRGLIWRSGDTWYGWSAEGPAAPRAEIRAEKDPAAAPEADYLRERQLRLSSTLADRRTNREAERERDEALRAVDPTRAPRPVYLGADVAAAEHALSPAGRWLVVVTDRGEKADGGRGSKMPIYVTESGYEESEDARTRVGRNAPEGQKLVLVDLQTGSQTPLALDPLPGIATDPLAALREKAGKPALEGNRAVRVDGIRWNDAGTRVAVMLRAVDNKDRWIATVDLAGGKLVPAHRLHDAAWINWSFNEFGWLPDNDTLWFLSEESGYSRLQTKSMRLPSADTCGCETSHSPRVSWRGAAPARWV